MTAGADAPASARVDVWIWSARLAKTRSAATAAVTGGHVRVNGERVKPAQRVRVGDEIRVRQGTVERIVEVRRVLKKRVGAPVAAESMIDRTPPPPARVERPAPVVRDRGAGRPTKRERRDIDRLRGRS